MKLRVITAAAAAVLALGAGGPELTGLNEC